MNKYSFPIRLKVLVAVLVILMLVVGVITATMANLFHQDKTAYVRDSSVVKTLNMRAVANISNVITVTAVDDVGNISYAPLLVNAK